MENSKADGKQTRKAAVHVGFAALALALLPVALHGGAVTQANPPSECNPAGNTCGCPVGGDHGVDNECIKAWLGLGRTTPWSGRIKGHTFCLLSLFAFQILANYLPYFRWVIQKAEVKETPRKNSINIVVFV